MQAITDARAAHHRGRGAAVAPAHAPRGAVRVPAARAGRAARASSPIVYFPSCATRAPWDAQRGDDAEALPAVTERLLRKAGFDVVYPDAAGRPLLRPALREQGTSPLPPIASPAELEAALMRGERRRAHPDRVRHEPLRLPDETLARRAGSRSWTSSSSRTTVLPRRRRSRAQPRLGRRPSGVQPAQDGPRRQARGRRAGVQRRGRRRCRRRALLRLGRRQGLHDARAQRARAALPPGRAAGRAARHGFSSSRTCEIGLHRPFGHPLPVDRLPVSTNARVTAAIGPPGALNDRSPRRARPAAPPAGQDVVPLRRGLLTDADVGGLDDLAPAVLLRL